VDQTDQQGRHRGCRRGLGRSPLWATSFWWRRLSLPWDNQTAIASAVPAVAIVWAIWWLWWRLPRRQLVRLSIQIPDPKARADTEDNFRKTVGQVLGGAAVLIGAGAAYLQFTQQQQASRDLLISNQVSKGFEQLAGTETAMRLGGIYALEGVMNAPSSQYRVPVLEALCAFVRESTKPRQGTLTTWLNAPHKQIWMARRQRAAWCGGGSACRARRVGGVLAR
jgi:hypothetical protein